MRNPTVIFLFLIPAIIALGHDTYLFYTNIVETKGFTLDLLLSEFKFSSLGYIWTSYDEEGFKMALMSTDKETWAWIDYLLTFQAFYLGLAFAAVMSFIFFFFGVVFGIGPLAFENGKVFQSPASSKKKEDTSFRSGQQSKKLNYKRK